MKTHIDAWLIIIFLSQFHILNLIVKPYLEVIGFLHTCIHDEYIPRKDLKKTHSLIGFECASSLKEGKSISQLCNEKTCDLRENNCLVST